MATSIRISGTYTGDATATASNIESGYTAYVDGQKITGTATVRHDLVKFLDSIEELPEAKVTLTATSISSFAIFGGGFSSSNSVCLDTVDAYSDLLTRSTAPNLYQAARQLASASVNDYAIFGGGLIDSNFATEITTAYNIELTESNPTNLTTKRYLLAASSNENYALFGGGYSNTPSAGASIVGVVDAYDSTLTRSSAESLYEPCYALAATHIGDYVLFGGGCNSVSGYAYATDKITAYSSTLTKSYPTALSKSRNQLSAVSDGTYALFAGGRASSNYNTVDAYDSNLTRYIAPTLPFTTFNLAGTSTQHHNIFGGPILCAYDNFLVLSSPPAMSANKANLAASSIGRYALFGGGSGAYSKTIDAYYEL